MSHFYVLTTPLFAKQHRFKLGCTTQSRSDLMKRYSTTLPDAFFAIYHPCQGRIVENIMLNFFESSRVPHKTGRQSEWIQGVSLKKIETIMIELFSQYPHVALPIAGLQLPDLLTIHGDAGNNCDGQQQTSNGTYYQRQIQLHRYKGSIEDPDQVTQCERNVGVYG